MKRLFQILLLLVSIQGLACGAEKGEEENLWTLIEGEETNPWRRQFDEAAKKDRLYKEMKKIGIFSTRGPYFFRNTAKDTVRALFYIGFVGRYEVELKLTPKPIIFRTLFRDGSKDREFKEFRPMYDAFTKDLLEKFGTDEDAEDPEPAPEKKPSAQPKSKGPAKSETQKEEKK